MSDSNTLFESCSSQFDPSNNLSGLLQCISDGHSEVSPVLLVIVGRLQQMTLHLIALHCISFHWTFSCVNIVANQIPVLMYWLLMQQISQQTSDLASGIDTFYLIFAGALVYFMQTGFAMLCAGSIRAKNVKNVILWNLLDSCGGGIAFWVCGYAFAYGGDRDGETAKTFVGNRGFFLKNDDSIAFENWFFQFAFACALSSIVAGTIAERTQMKAYLLYSVVLVGFCYPVVAHAFWSTSGFLSPNSADPLWGSGVIDLAGSGPVHMVGGVTALASAIILGPRKGRFHDENGNPLDEPNEFPPHSVALQFLGTFCLWFGCTYWILSFFIFCL